jgi:hypothetical protein
MHGKEREERGKSGPHDFKQAKKKCYNSQTKKTQIKF